MTHTPSPWRTEKGGLSKQHTVYGPAHEACKTGFILATVCHSNFFDDKGEEGLANTRLIAAAPELLETLKAIHGHLSNNDDCLAICEELARAAIASATNGG